VVSIVVIFNPIRINVASFSQSKEGSVAEAQKFLDNINHSESSKLTCDYRFQNSFPII